MKENSAKDKFNRSSLLRWLVIFSPAVLVFIFHENIVTGADSANFCLTLRYGFDIASYRPHPPGYPLLVLLWNIPYQLLPIKPHTALLIVNTAFMILAVAAIGKTYKLLWGEHGSLFAMILLASSPLFIYYGCTGEMYVYDAAFSLIIFNAFYQATRKRLPIYCLLFALAGGIRQSSMIFLIPLVALILWYRRKELQLSIASLLLSVGSGIVGLLLWFVPLILSVGGLASYQALLLEATDVRATAVQNIATVSSVALWILLPSVVFFFRRNKTLAQIGKYSMFFLAWIAPPLLFFIFRHYSKGYLLIVAPVYFLLAARWIAVQYPERSKKIIALCSVAGILLFLYMPFISMPYQSTLAKSHRTSGERLRSAVTRLISTIGPTNAHLRATEAQMQEMKAALSGISDSATVIIDPSADASITRCMQEEVPRHLYARLQLDDSSNMLVCQGKDFYLFYDAEKIFSRSPLYLICGSGWNEYYREYLMKEPIASGKHTSVFKLESTDIPPVRRMLNGLYLSQ